MADYNSKVGDAQKGKVVTKVVNGVARTKKKTKFREFLDMFIANDVGDVKSYILAEVIVPAIKKTIEEAVHTILNGKDTRRSSPGRASYIRYDTMSKSDNRPRTRSGYDYGEVIVDTRDEAKAVLDRMDELIATYQTASVADLYDLAGLQCNHTDNKYGWTDVRDAQIIPMRDGGFLIKMPRAFPLD